MSSICHKIETTAATKSACTTQMPLFTMAIKERDHGKQKRQWPLTPKHTQRTRKNRRKPSLKPVGDAEVSFNKALGHHIGFTL